MSIHVTVHGPAPAPVVRPVEVDVRGTTVFFNGVPTLLLNEPLPLAAVLADPIAQHVAEMYARGFVHRG